MNGVLATAAVLVAAASLMAACGFGLCWAFGDRQASVGPGGLGAVLRVRLRSLPAVAAGAVAGTAALLGVRALSAAGMPVVGEPGLWVGVVVLGWLGMRWLAALAARYERIPQVSYAVKGGCSPGTTNEGGWSR